MAHRVRGVDHHREAPQALADGEADVAMVCYHLALRFVRVYPGGLKSYARGGTRRERGMVNRRRGWW